MDVSYEKTTQEDGHDFGTNRDNPERRLKRVHDKLQSLLFNIGKGRVLQIANHMWRNTEDTSYLINLELTRFQELTVLRIDGNWRVLHSFFENCHLASVTASSKCVIPAFS